MPEPIPAAAAAIGSALADLIAGYVLYAPATLVIKAIMAFLAALVYHALGRRRWALLPCGILAEAIMVLGYWGYDSLLTGSLMGAAAGLPSNLTQAVFGLAASTALTLALKASAYVRNEFPSL